MKYAADFRNIARKVLAGRWKIAVIAGLLAALLGGLSSGGPNFEFDGNESHIEIPAEFLSVAVILICIGAAVLFFLHFILGSVVGVGYARFRLDMMDREKKPAISTLFQDFKRWKTTFATRFLKELYIFLWSLLLFIPGIIASYSYSMTDYLLAEHPEMTAREAIRQSKEMMKGNRGRLFCLQFSFIGWMFLSIVTMGIGNLWLTPYMSAAEAAFYYDLTGREFVAAARDDQ